MAATLTLGFSPPDRKQGVIILRCLDGEKRTNLKPYGLPGGYHNYLEGRYLSKQDSVPHEKREERGFIYTLDSLAQGDCVFPRKTFIRAPTFAMGQDTREEETVVESEGRGARHYGPGLDTLNELKKNHRRVMICAQELLATHVTEAPNAVTSPTIRRNGALETIFDPPTNTR